MQQWLAAVHRTVRYGLNTTLNVPRSVSETHTLGAGKSFQQTLQTG
ncbi:hypothetical protein [Parathermosynechococcus lividus]